MTAYIKVWSLCRGAIDPPEPCSAEENYMLNREALMASLERDPPMTCVQWLEETRPFRNSENFRSRRRA